MKPNRKLTKKKNRKPMNVTIQQTVQHFSNCEKYVIVDR